MKQNQPKINAPVWDLSSVYSDVGGENYVKALKDLEKGFDAVKKLLASPEKDEKFPEWLKKTVETQNKTDVLYHSLLSYANAAYTTDTTNTKYLNAVSFLQEKGLVAKAYSLSCFAYRFYLCYL